VLSLLIHGSSGNNSGSFNNFAGSTGSVGPIRMAQCQVEARFGYAATGRETSFTNFSREDAIDFEWDFGDGNTSFLDNPRHTYSTDGTYNVCLRSRTRNYCESELCTTVQIPNGVSNVEGVLAKAPSLEVFQQGDQLTLKLTSGSFQQVELFDMAGRSVITRQASNQYQVNIATAVLPKGVYTVRAVLIDGQILSHRTFLN